MSLLFNMLSRLVIAFLPKSECLLLSWWQSPSTVILEPRKINSATVSTVSPSICHEVMGPDVMILVFWMLSFKPTFLLSSFTYTYIHIQVYVTHICVYIFCLLVFLLLLISHAYLELFIYTDSLPISRTQIKKCICCFPLFKVSSPYHFIKIQEIQISLISNELYFIFLD